MKHLLKQPVSIYRHTEVSTNIFGESIASDVFLASEECSIQRPDQLMLVREIGFPLIDDVVIYASASSIIAAGDRLYYGSDIFRVEGLNKIYRFNTLHHLRLTASIVRRPTNA